MQILHFTRVSSSDVAVRKNRMILEGLRKSDLNTTTVLACPYGKIKVLRRSTPLTNENYICFTEPLPSDKYQNRQTRESLTLTQLER